MGAFDEVSGECKCPRCGANYSLHLQTKFFDPDFGGYYSRQFQKGRNEPLEQSLSELANATAWDDQWFRVRDTLGPERLSVVADWDDCFTCSCQAHLGLIRTGSVGRG